MTFNSDFLQHELRAKSKKEILENAYPQIWLADDYAKRQEKTQPQGSNSVQ